MVIWNLIIYYLKEWELWSLLVHRDFDNNLRPLMSHKWSEMLFISEIILYTCKVSSKLMDSGRRSCVVNDLDMLLEISAPVHNSKFICSIRQVTFSKLFFSEQFAETKVSTYNELLENTCRREICFSGLSWFPKRFPKGQTRRFL